MTSTTLRLVSLAATLTCLLSACGDPEKGACVPRANPVACGDDFTAGQCDLVNGDFYPGKTCDEIGP